MPQFITLASASIDDVAIWRPPRVSLLDKASELRRRTLYRYEPISLFEISLTDTSQALPPEAALRRGGDGEHG